MDRVATSQLQGTVLVTQRFPLGSLGFFFFFTTSKKHNARWIGDSKILLGVTDIPSRVYSHLIASVPEIDFGPE